MDDVNEPEEWWDIKNIGRVKTEKESPRDADDRTHERRNRHRQISAPRSSRKPRPLKMIWASLRFWIETERRHELARIRDDS